ncbi:hypothetical protein GCM10027422_18930 [Hymenobacter arcticus]
MFFSSPRQAQALLLHAVIWGLLGVLVFTQPTGEVPAPQAYWLQAGLLAGLLGVFYLNAGWAVPRLLYGQRGAAYFGFLVVVVVGVAASHRLVQQRLATPRQLGGAQPRPSRWEGRAPHPPGPAQPGGRPPRRPPSGPGSGWANPAVLLSTLLVLGLGTSVAAVQRGQREALARAALEQEKLSTELSWLKAQLNPHFFFNTLNNIYSLTLLDGEQARDAIHRLSRLMRYVLYDTATGLAPLSQEIQFVQDYIDLMHLRLTDNVAVKLSLPQPLHEAAIAPLLLLTFVENAFKHGVSALVPCTIVVVVRQPTPATLDVTVENDVFPDRPRPLDGQSGIGLANTRRRLNLLYPGRHTLRITSLATHYQVQLTLTLLP